MDAEIQEEFDAEYEEPVAEESSVPDAIDQYLETAGKATAHERRGARPLQACSGRRFFRETAACGK